MMTANTIADPRAPFTAPRRKGANMEKWSWVFMRASGVLLVVLIFGHLIVNMVMGDGVHQIDFAFVAGKWASPFWQWWDVVMLWLALIHGGNGIRTIIEDYVTHDVTRRILLWAVRIAAAFLILLGTLVVFTFDPCPAGSPADLLPSFCSQI